MLIPHFSITSTSSNFLKTSHINICGDWKRVALRFCKPVMFQVIHFKKLFGDIDYLTISKAHYKLRQLLIEEERGHLLLESRLLNHLLLHHELCLFDLQILYFSVGFLFVLLQ